MRTSLHIRNPPSINLISWNRWAMIYRFNYSTLLQIFLPPSRVFIRNFETLFKRRRVVYTRTEIITRLSLWSLYRYISVSVNWQFTTTLTNFLPSVPAFSTWNELVCENALSCYRLLRRNRLKIYPKRITQLLLLYGLSCLERNFVSAFFFPLYTCYVRQEDSHENYNYQMSILCTIRRCILLYSYDKKIITSE